MFNINIQDKEVNSYQWLPTHKMWVDILTTEMKMPSGLELVLLNNILDFNILDDWHSLHSYFYTFS